MRNICSRKNICIDIYINTCGVMATREDPWRSRTDRGRMSDKYICPTSEKTLDLLRKWKQITPHVDNTLSSRRRINTYEAKYDFWFFFFFFIIIFFFAKPLQNGAHRVIILSKHVPGRILLAKYILKDLRETWSNSIFTLEDGCHINKFGVLSSNLASVLPWWKQLK